MLLLSSVSIWKKYYRYCRCCRCSVTLTPRRATSVTMSLMMPSVTVALSSCGAGLILLLTTLALCVTVSSSVAGHQWTLDSGGWPECDVSGPGVQCRLQTGAVSRNGGIVLSSSFIQLAGVARVASGWWLVASSLVTTRHPSSG